MYQNLKSFIFYLISASLLLRFMLLAGDPAPFEAATGAAQNGLPIYTYWHPVIHWIYQITNILELPVDLIITLMVKIVPVIKQSWFPFLQMETLLDKWLKLIVATPNVPWPEFLVQQLKSGYILKFLPGYLEWPAILSISLYGMLAPLLDKVTDIAKNLLWNVLIEFSFTKRKQAVYQEALEKRARELMKLNVEYRNLSKEAGKLKDYVVTDELTQVFNKRFFIQKIQEEFQNAKQGKSNLSLIMIDIDHFKRLNDTYGHLMGDKVLQTVAGVAKRACPADCFCCRFGGEEFSIIMPGKTLEEALVVADTIKTAIPQLRFEEDPALSVTISQGVSFGDFKMLPAQALQKFDEFIQLADNELYRAKLEGRDRICYKKME